ncbi:MAG: hypothetical protein HY093_01320 [Candidatus Liptonbacteria bacterium]|nr:hypothetical protein [Candidatus Liptonbacteria bacterium]
MTPEQPPQSRDESFKKYAAEGMVDNARRQDEKIEAALRVLGIDPADSEKMRAVETIIAAAFILLFQKVDQNSHSASDTLLNFAPYAITILLVFDLLCFRIGEYPSWWRRKNKS